MEIKGAILTLIAIFLSLVTHGQNTISGFVKDQETGEMLIGATVIEKGTTNGTCTDNNGYFTLTAKSSAINVSFIGYKSVAINSANSKTKTVLIELVPGTELGEVQVIGSLMNRFNVSKLSKQEMYNIPAIGGKPDVLKALQLLPGIQMQQEGTSLMMVRGGSPGENLYLIDNIPLIYVNHLGGFTSVFNPDMINNIEVYKGGFPAKYGGKLSSIVAITQREGDRSGRKGSLSIGITDVSFSIEGPTKNNKASFIITGRKTMIDPLMILSSGLSSGDYYFFYGFHDINSKFTWKPNERNNFSFNFYQGDDYMRFWTKKQKSDSDKSSLTNVWGNWLGAARWNHVVSPRLFVDNTLSYTRYRLKLKQSYSLKSETENTNFEKEYFSSVQDYSLRSDWKFNAQRYWSIDFGGKATYMQLLPNRITQSNITNVEPERIGVSENSVYANNNLRLINCIDVNIGVRGVNYASEGYSNLSIEPRLNMSFSINKNQILNASYQQVSQFTHLVFTSGAILSNEVWIPATKQIPPGRSEQYTLGWKGIYFKNMFETEVTIYSKSLSNLATYKEGYTNLMGDGNWRNKIEKNGTGKASGAELLIRKNGGNWTGMLSYAYSKTTRRFPTINQGEAYRYDYDRPHTLSLNVNKQLSPKWVFNMVWTYQSGLPFTPAIGVQLNAFNEESLIYGKRNSEQMGNYHRMDVGLIYTKQNRHNRKTEWNFSIYNLYNRHNPNIYYYKSGTNNGVNSQTQLNESFQSMKLYQVSIFPIIPTVSYKVYFDRKSDRVEPEKSNFKQKLKNYFYHVD